MSLDVKSYNNAMHESSFFVGYDCCSIYELPICYTCCGFSHLANNCNKAIKCPECDDLGVSDCRISDKKKFKTINSLFHKPITVDHAA